MTIEKHNGAAHEISWWSKAVLATMTGLIASLTIGGLLAVLSSQNYGWAKQIEQYGIDWGIKTYSQFYFDKAPLRKKFLFVDVDEAACITFEKDPFFCRAKNPVSPKLIASFVKAARNSKASIVILDVAPLEKEADRQFLKKILAKEDDGPWIIAPVNGRPFNGSSVELYGDRDSDIVLSGAEGKLRLASFIATTDPNIEGGEVRIYPSTNKLIFRDGSRLIPSAPYLAANLARGKDLQSIDCAFYNLNCQRINNSTSSDKNGYHMRTIDEDKQIIFSLPTLSAQSKAKTPHENRIRDNAATIGLEHIHASRLIDLTTQEFEKRTEKYEGRIVVLGSSLPGAMDIHSTPVGPMTGAEILINATQTLLNIEDKGAEEESHEFTLPDRIKKKFSAAILGSIIMAPIWLLIYRIVFLKQKEKSRAKKIIYSLSCAILFFSGLIATAAWELQHEITDIVTEGMSQRRGVDLLAPILALGLEGYAEAMKQFLFTTEKAMEHVFIACTAKVKETYSKLKIKS